MSHLEDFIKSTFPTGSKHAATMTRLKLIDITFRTTLEFSQARVDKGYQYDDSALFVHMHRSLVEAVIESDNVVSPLLRVAIDYGLETRINEMREFEQSLRDRGMLTLPE